MSKKMFLGVALFMAAWFVACGDDDDSVGVNEPSVPQSSAETASSSETVYSSEAISEYSSSEILPLSSSVQEILESSSSIEIPLSSFEGVSSSLVLSSLSEKISSSSAKYTYSSSSVPAAKADSIIWKSRGKETIVRRYDDDSSAIQKAGRFWIVKESTMNGKETDLLKQFGINGRLSVATYNDEIRLVLCTSENDVRKKLLDSLLYGFFNSFTADDTTKLEVKFEEDDWYKKRSVCDSLGSCHTVIDTLQSIEMTTSCWKDVSMERCKEIVDSCGGEKAFAENSVWSFNTRETINCLASHKDVNLLKVVHPEETTYRQKSVFLRMCQMFTRPKGNFHPI